MATIIEVLNEVGSTGFGLGKVFDENPAWQNHNFPDWRAYPSRLVMGICEEVGELIDAINAYCDSVDSNANQSLTRTIGQFNEIVDALGDIAVYSVAYAGCRDLEVTIEPPGKVSSRSASRAQLIACASKLSSSAGLVCHAQLKSEQGIRGYADALKQKSAQAMNSLMGDLDEFCCLIGSSLDEIVETTWNTVRVRDWAANRDNGESKKMRC